MAGQSDEPGDIFSVLGDVPTEIAPDGLPKRPDDWVASLPTAIPSFDLVDFPASDSQGRSAQATTKIPEAWIEFINQLRDSVAASSKGRGIRLPDMFKTNARVYRWCIGVGIRKLTDVVQVLSDENIDGSVVSPIIQSSMFLENIGGALEARARVANDCADKVATIARSVNILIANGEEAEAADMLNQWIAGARAIPSPFWSHFFCKTLINEPEMQEPLGLLIDTRRIIDDYMISLCLKAGVIAHRPPLDEND